MSVEKARNNYIGKNGFKMNCAQSVADAFKDKYNVSQEAVDSFGMCGGGRAPKGMCGALYAAKTILEKSNQHDEAKKLEQLFAENAGAITCQDIKLGRKLSCVGCVEKTSEFLHNNKK